jgi:hypothetical protein
MTQSGTKKTLVFDTQMPTLELRPLQTLCHRMKSRSDLLMCIALRIAGVLRGCTPPCCFLRSVPVPPLCLRISVAPSHILSACLFESARLPCRLSACRCCLFRLVGETLVKSCLLFRAHLRQRQRMELLLRAILSYFGLDLSALFLAELRLWLCWLLRLALTHLADDSVL